MNVDIFKCSGLQKNLYLIKGKNTKQVQPVEFTVACNKTSKVQGQGTARCKGVSAVSSIFFFLF